MDNDNKRSVGGIFLKIPVIKRMIEKDRQTRQYVRVMDPRARPEERVFAIWEKRIGLIFVLIVAAVFLWIYLSNSDTSPGMLTDGHYLIRPEEEKDVTLDVSGESESGSWENKFTLPVSDREFSTEEMRQISDKIKKYVDGKIRGNNPSLSSVNNKLVLVKRIPEIDAKLSWTYEDSMINSDGSLIGETIPREGIDTELMLTATWKNYKDVFYYKVHLIPPVSDPKDRAIQDAGRLINQAITDQSSSERVELPDKYTYFEEKESTNFMPVILILLVICAMPFFWKEEYKKGQSLRQEQMMIDHPGFINKVMLLLGAGLTLRFTIERMAGEYERELLDGGEKHYVYEELCVTMQELKDGVTESQAVENFGRRCKCMPYMRFASVITQNLRKGAEGILAILEQEATDSLIERKQAALRRGEVAGTKLLFPMMVMLGLVMGIIMVPAFMSM